MSVIRKQSPSDRVVTAIRQQVMDGSLRAGDYILPERELAKKYSVSVRMVREGLGKLAAEKLIRRHQGKGTIVLARAAKTGRPALQTVAVVIQGRIRDTSTAELVDVLQQALQAHGFGLTLYVSEAFPERETAIFRQLVRDRLPGAVLFSVHPATSFTHLTEARAAGMKLVLVDHDFPGFACDSVAIDDQLGGFEATAHLIRVGCAELVHVTVDQDWTSVALRRKGFEEAGVEDR